MPTVAQGHRPHHRALAAEPPALPRPDAPSRRETRHQPPAPVVRQFRPRLRRRRGGQAGDPHAARAQHRHRHRLQRHAFGASALRAAIPEQMKIYAREVGATAQVAGGVPAMCDGVTQGQPGMDLSLFSRDVIAMGTAVALSHGMFDAVALLGICDKIVPGLLIGALALRPSADAAGARRADAVGPRQHARSSASASCSPKARSAATSCSRPRPNPTTAPAPAPSTAPPIPTR